MEEDDRQYRGVGAECGEGVGEGEDLWLGRIGQEKEEDAEERLD